MATAPGITEKYLEETLAHEQTSLWGDAWRRLRRNRLALVSSVFLTLLIVVAIVAQFWTPYSYFTQGLGPIYQGPTAQHWLGLDQSGRDILSRIMLGAQISLKVGIGTQLVVIVVGVVIGLVAGFYRGFVDTIISTVINIFYGIPDLLVALTLVLLLGRSLGIIIFAIAFTQWMNMARLVRGQTLALREREFVEAARSGGAKANRIIFRHILPNALGPMIVQATIGVPMAILFEAFLSFLGLGVPPPTPSWGAMAADGFHAIRISPHIVLAPAIALSLTLMAFNFLGDGLRDALDPRQKR
ncbi:MAG: ABC transporter permease [Chloroflexi bacterium]|nr:MAG: ABC transporter permease [Chloroflexota bacterium]